MCEVRGYAREGMFASFGACLVAVEPGAECAEPDDCDVGTCTVEAFGVDAVPWSRCDAARTSGRVAGEVCTFGDECLGGLCTAEGVCTNVCRISTSCPAVPRRDPNGWACRPAPVTDVYGNETFTSVCLDYNVLTYGKVGSLCPNGASDCAGLRCIAGTCAP